MASDVADRVRSVLSRLSGVPAENITLDMSLRKDLGQSDIRQVIMAFEDEFGMEIPNDGEEKLPIERVDEAIAYIQQRQAGRA